MKISIFNGLTNETEIRDMTADEIEIYNNSSKQLEQFEQEKLDKQIAKQAVLDKLGLTEQEAQLLLGS